MMKQIIILSYIWSCLFCCKVLGYCLDNSNASCAELLSTPYVYQSVNVITGDYCEAHTDSVLLGGDIKVRRCFSSSEGWTFSLPLREDSHGSHPSSLIYEYDTAHWLKAIKGRSNNNGHETIAEIFYPSPSRRELCLLFQNGDSLTYSFVDPIISRSGNDALAVSSFRHGSQDISSYEYIQHPTQRKYLIAKKCAPEGRYCINEYYDAKENDVGGVKVLISDPMRDPRMGRVKLQKAPVGDSDEPVTIARYFYYPDHTEVFDALNRKTVYRYNQQGYLISIEEYLDQQLYRKEKLFWVCQESSELLQLRSKVCEDGQGRPVVCHTFDYDVHGNKVAETLYGNISGTNETPLIINEEGKPIENGIESYSTRWVYSADDPALLMCKFEDNGKIVHFRYDPMNKKMTAELTSDGIYIRHRRFFKYDNDGHLIEAIVDDGSGADSSNLEGVTERHVLAFVCLKEGPAYGHPQLVEEKYLDRASGALRTIKRINNEYDQQGYLIRRRVTDARDYILLEKVFIRDAHGRLVYEDGGSGMVQECSYDVHGNIIWQRTSKGGKPQSEQYHFYDKADRRIRTDEIDDKGNASSSSYRYNYAGEKIASTDRYGNTILYAYDSLGRMSSTVYPEVLDQDDHPFSPKISCTYDILNNIVEKIDANGNIIAVRYNVRKQPIEKRAADGTIEHFLYALDGSLLQATAKDGTVTRYQYNCFGQPTLIETFDAAGKLRSSVLNIYNAFHLMQTIENGDQYTFYKYNDAGQLISERRQSSSSVASGASRTDCWEYDGSNRLVAYTEAAETQMMRTTRYNYNDDGLLSELVKPDGIVLHHSYDELGQLHEYYSSDHTIHYKFSYDSRNRLIGVEDKVHNNTTSRFLNSAGQVLSEELGNGLGLKKTYDPLGRCHSLILPDGSFINYEYDANRLVEIQRFSKEQVLQYKHRYSAFSPGGRILEMSLIGSAGNVSIEYDFERHIKAILSNQWMQEIPEEGYDRMGNLLSYAINDAAGMQYAQLRYDHQGQIISEEGEATLTYAYDQRSNRINIGGRSALVDMLDQLISYPHDGQQVPYEYDKRGNLVSKHMNGKCTKYCYDALDRLVSVEIEKDRLIQFTYDCFHRRLAKTISYWDPSQGQWTFMQSFSYLYDGDHEIGAVDEKGEIVELRILGVGQGAEIGAAVSHEIQGTAYAPIHDHRGSVACLIDARSGRTAECYRYSAFGEVSVYSESGERLSASAINNPWMFSSKRADAETDLVFYGKRYYDPSIGRWLTKDPLGAFDHPNPYAFVRNNPHAYIDPCGLFSWSCLWNEACNAGGSLLAAVETMTELLYSFEKNYSYTNHVQAEWHQEIEKFFGTGFLQFIGYYQDDMSTGVFNPDHEISDNVRITLINGILNIRSDLEWTAEHLSKAHGGNSVHYVFHPTEGWTIDIINCYLVKVGFVSPRATLLSKMWKQLIREVGGIGGGGKILHYAHSIGATDTYAAINLLTEEEKKMIHVVTLGSPSLIPASAGFASVLNYVSKRDAVCLLDPVSYIKAWLFDDDTISFVGTFWGIPLIDHTLYMDTYSDIIKKLGEDFLNVYSKSHSR